MTDTDREAFEAWWRQYGIRLGGFEVPWEAYQAATQRHQSRIAALEAEVAALRKDAERLDKPAQVGGGIFGVGVETRHVIRAAQRYYERKSAEAVQTQEDRIEEERKRRAFWDFINGPLDAAIEAVARPIQECYGDCPTNPVTCPNPCKFNGRPAPQQAEAVPPGWKLVPVEPTEEMLKAAQGSLKMPAPILKVWRDGRIKDYRAMLAAAPKGQQP